MNYRVKTPWFFKNILYKRLTWDIKTDTEPTVYLTFDDGPHPEATKFVLEQLKEHSAHGTFFCIGKNVDLYPEIYQQIIDQGHSVGNHTYNHLNGWKHSTHDYISNITKAKNSINSKLFRPPYGRIKRTQIKALIPEYNIVMWDVLSGDFDMSITPEKCLNNVIKNIQPGSIVVFHDSEKAWERMSYALPQVLKYCKEKSWQIKSLTDK